ncbi:CNNM domain-containing protein [Micromonospora sp. NPDC047465]|uniref:hemolysin family protein n=1 Tax=Micromonospora sp. NPDC047465 TaxID=3154813 RepID=UPI0033C2AD18
MQSIWSQLALVGFLVVLNAVFAGSEMALVSLRDSQVQRLERTSRAGRVLARLARDPNRFLATIQIGITLAGFLASAAAAVSLARPLVPLLGALGGAGRQLKAVLVPRLQVFTLDSGTTAEAARLLLAATGHSRAPVVRHGGLDDAVGVIHLRDLVGVRDGRPVDECVRPPMLLPDSLPVVDALRQFKAERQHIALVVDERGAVDGIVTLEDILEEIVGEIYDETDRDVRAVRTEPDGAMLLPGTFPVHDLTDVGVELPGRPGGDYTTIAGLVLTCLGHIPTVAGESVTVDGWELEVARIDHRAITGVWVRRPGRRATTSGSRCWTRPAAERRHRSPAGVRVRRG